MKLPGRCSPLRRRIAPPLVWVFVLGLAALAALAVPVSRTRFEYVDLGHLRKGVVGQDDVSLTLMVDRLPGMHRTMLLYYLYPASRQTPMYGYGVPMSPDPTLIATGVATVQAADIDDKAGVLALAHRGGGAYWTPVPRDLWVMGASLLLALLAATNIVKSIRWRLARRRASRRIDMVDRGLCPMCRYTIGVVAAKHHAVCPECAACPQRIRRRAVTLLARGRSRRGWRWSQRALE